MLRPSRVYLQLQNEAIEDDWRLAARRPLFVAILMGCMVSLLASERLTLRLIVGGAISATFILLTQVGALALVRRSDSLVSRFRTVDLFFAGYGPWSLWMAGMSAAWAFASPAHALAWAGLPTILASASLVALWSACIDFCFFRSVLELTPTAAFVSLLLQRTVSWGLALIIFGQGAIAPEVLRICRKW